MGNQILQGQGRQQQPQPDPNQQQSGSQPAGAQQGQQAGGEPRYVTQDEVDRLVEEKFRKAQSLVDKSAHRIEQRVSGVQPAEQQQQQQQQQPAATQGTSSQASDQSVEEMAQQNPVLADALNLQRQAGVELVEGDPEASQVVVNQGPYAFLKSMEAALNAKKERLASTNTQTDAQDETPAAARLPATGQPGAFVAKDVNEYWKRAKAERKK